LDVFIKKRSFDEGNGFGSGKTTKPGIGRGGEC